jgi:hypothetical protein
MQRLALMALILAAASVEAPAADRWLHVRVDAHDGEAQRVRINVPLEVAEKVLPSIHADRLQGGKVKIEGDLSGVDLRSLVDALRSAADGEFVTVESRTQHVRVTKQGTSFLVKVRERHGARERAPETVDIRNPLTRDGSLALG